MGFVATMSSKGQLTVPKEVRDALKLATGTQLFVTVHDGKLVAWPKNGTLADLAGVLGKPEKGAGATLEDFDEAIGQAAAADDERITREWNELHGTKK